MPRFAWQKKLKRPSAQQVLLQFTGWFSWTCCRHAQVSISVWNIWLVASRDFTWFCTTIGKRSIWVRMLLHVLVKFWCMKFQPFLYFFIFSCWPAHWYLYLRGSSNLFANVTSRKNNSFIHYCLCEFSISNHAASYAIPRRICPSRRTLCYGGSA